MKHKEEEAFFFGGGGGVKSNGFLNNFVTDFTCGILLSEHQQRGSFEPVSQTQSKNPVKQKWVPT